MIKKPAAGLWKQLDTVGQADSLVSPEGCACEQQLLCVLLNKLANLYPIMHLVRVHASSQHLLCYLRYCRHHRLNR
jgi:hypothetical protein